MITIGVDAHKRMHVALALGDAGQELGQWRGLNSAAGWRSLAQWGAELGCLRQWANRRRLELRPRPGAIHGCSR
jgi:hypothetical protein